jgi:hypothetical protein
MRNVAWMLLAGLVLPCVGCAGNAGLNGKWLGSITEKEKITKVALELHSPQDRIEGTFTILSNAAQGIAEDTPFELINARRSDKTLQFVVPISGQFDIDAVFFELLIKGNRLEGIGRKMRKGSPELLTVFVKQK